MGVRFWPDSVQKGLDAPGTFGETQRNTMAQGRIEMKICVIFDIHNQITKVKKILEIERPDFTIFGGDFFDSWWDSVELAEKTSHYLIELMNNPRNIFLWGNHDLLYAYSKNYYASCGGYTLDKDNMINSIIKKEHWDRFQFFHIDNKILFTHAGLTNQFIEESKVIPELPFIKTFLTEESKNAKVCLEKGGPHWFYAIGRIRGGMNKVGGIIWCDTREFKSTPNLRQIFGHTEQEKPLWIENSLCMDVKMQYYGVLENGEFNLKMYDCL